MILKALYDYYQTLVSSKETNVPSFGYSRERISFVIKLSQNGDFLDLVNPREDGKPVWMEVPEHPGTRTTIILPYFLCDNAKYLLGLCNDPKHSPGQKYFEESAKLHTDILKNINDVSAIAVLEYFKKFDLKKAEDKIKPYEKELNKGSNLIFSVEGIEGYVHDVDKIRAAWINVVNNKKSTTTGQCLVTGKIKPISRIHNKVKGVRGTRATGACMISFNQESFESYRKKQSINSPIGEDVVFAYTTALNYMLNYSRFQKVQIGDTSVVFWAERYGAKTEELFYALFDPTILEERKDQEGKKESDNEKTIDEATVKRMRDFLIRAASGKEINDFEGYDPDIKFYILGLAPNAARISVKFFYAQTFGKIAETIRQHYEDMAIEKQYEDESDFIAAWQILKETAVQRDTKNIIPTYTDYLLTSILTGNLYPAAIYQSIINRIVTDEVKVNRNRVAFLKAYLQRKARIINKQKGGVTMSLNPEEKNVGYCLGRMFALLEKAQQDASPEINTTIKDRYFDSASSSPRAVFPELFRLAQYHISCSKYGINIDKRIEEVMSLIGGPEYIPAYLSLDDQAMFIIGYYHQKNDLYTKKEKKEE